MHARGWKTLLQAVYVPLDIIRINYIGDNAVCREGLQTMERDSKVGRKTCSVTRGIFPDAHVSAFF